MEIKTNSWCHIIGIKIPFGIAYYSHYCCSMYYAMFFFIYFFMHISKQHSQDLTWPSIFSVIFRSVQITNYIYVVHTNWLFKVRLAVNISITLQLNKMVLKEIPTILFICVIIIMAVVNFAVRTEWLYTMVIKTL